MSYTHIKKQLKLIREQVDGNIDFHFKEYLMVDFIGQNEMESIIDEMDWYGYWKMVAINIKSVMDDLLEFTGLEDTAEGLGYDKNSEANQLLSEIMDYKIICDGKLISNKYYKQVNVFEEVLGFSKDIKLDKNLPPVKILNEAKKQEIIEVIYSYIEEAEYIDDVELDTFVMVFDENITLSILRWDKDAISFVAFINALIDKKIIALPKSYKDKCWEYFRQIFLDKNGNQFSTNLLGNRKAQKTYNDKYDKIIKELMSRLSPYIEDTNQATN